jgi:hypothetical protein
MDGGGGGGGGVAFGLHLPKSYKELSLTFSLPSKNLNVNSTSIIIGAL